MNRHLTDDEVLDLAAGARLEWAESHLAVCPECRAAVEMERPLSERLAGLPDEADPPRDLWPEVWARVDREGRVVALRGWRRPALQAAAAVAIFAAGALMGRASGSGEGGGVVVDDPLVAAAEVQRTGTEYVAAVARFRALEGHGEQAEQARAVALAAVQGAAWELTRMDPEDWTALRLVAMAGGRGAEREAP